MLDSSTESPSAGPLRKLIDHHLWSPLFLFLPTLSFILFILPARRFAAPLRLGLVCEASAFKGFVSLLVLVGRLLLSSPCAPSLFFLCVSFCCVGAHFSCSQSLQLPSASPALPIVCAEVARSFALHFLLCFFFFSASSSLLACALVSSFSTSRTRLCFFTQRDMQSLFSR